MKRNISVGIFVFAIFVLILGVNRAAVASMGTYAAYPPFLSQTVKPNVLVILDTSTSMLSYAYSGSYSTTTTYDGYFDSTANYSYNSTQEYFYEDSGGSWDGNLLNWISMRRMDIAKKVLTGGRTTTAGDGSTLLLGQPYPNNCGCPG